MGMFSVRELLNNGGKVRELDLKDGATKKIWIPDLNSALYKRIHFEVQKIPEFKNSKRKNIDCFNQNHDGRGAGCPICDGVIAKLWEQWREADKAKNAELKTKIKGSISKLMAEYYYLNAIDVSDDDFKFVAVKFTRSKLMELVTEENALHAKDKTLKNRIFYYKFKKEPKAEYTLTAVEDPITEKLIKMYAQLVAREYKDGGPVDLEKGYSFQKYHSVAEYHAVLTGSDDVEDHSSDDLDNPLAESSSSSTKTTVLEESSLSLEDIGLESDVPFDGATKVAETKPKAEETVPNLDDSNLGLDDLDLGLDTEPAKEMLKISAADFKQICADKKIDMIEKCYTVLFGSKKIAECKSATDKAKTIYGYLTKNDPIEIEK